MEDKAKVKEETLFFDTKSIHNANLLIFGKTKKRNNKNLGAAVSFPTAPQDKERNENA